MTLRPSDLGNTANNWIGRSAFTADPYFDGLVDDFRVYNRALTAAEITALYAVRCTLRRRQLLLLHVQERAVLVGREDVDLAVAGHVARDEVAADAARRVDDVLDERRAARAALELEPGR